MRDTGIFWEIRASLLNWQFELPASCRHTRNRHPAALCYASICKECFVLVKSDCHYPLQLIHIWCGLNMANVCCLYTEKFALEVAYRETRPPFWDALISSYRRPMTNGGVVTVALRSLVSLVALLDSVMAVVGSSSTLQYNKTKSRQSVNQSVNQSINRSIGWSIIKQPFNTLIHLYICRFQATGETYRSLAFGYTVSASTHIVREVCQAVWEKGKDIYMKMPMDAGEWRGVAAELERLWRFPPLPGCYGWKTRRHEGPKEIR